MPVEPNTLYESPQTSPDGQQITVGEGNWTLDTPAQLQYRQIVIDIEDPDRRQITGNLSGFLAINWSEMQIPANIRATETQIAIIIQTGQAQAQTATQASVQTGTAYHLTATAASILTQTPTPHPSCAINSSPIAVAFSFDGGLPNHENVVVVGNSRGHTLSEHVNVQPEYIYYRALNNTNGRPVTAHWSYLSAEASTGLTLTANELALLNWFTTAIQPAGTAVALYPLPHVQSGNVLGYTFTDTTGYGFVRAGSSRVISFSREGNRIFLRCNLGQRSLNPYTIITSYPN